MRILYDLLTQLTGLHLWIAQFFSKKLKLFVKGRKGVLKLLSDKLESTDKTIWFHCASLGEFEQGVPIMEAVRKIMPEYKIVVSFFSPSGYEIKKNSSLADLIVYLPLDTMANARKFVEIVHPSLAIFVKYEFWPNYLFELQKDKIPTLLVSGLFRPNQIFFKPLGGFMRKALRSFNHLFVQDEASLELLSKIHIENCSISGDTRFDRVSNQIGQDNSLEFVKEFKAESLCIVCGSTWPEDELMLLDFINNASENVKFILAPHKINASKIDAFRKTLQKKNVLYSEKDNKNLEDYSVLIVDTIGLLTKIYSYADIAYVGGAAGYTGLHNILEPATFGVPIVIGQNFENFPEAIRLNQLAGLFPVSSSEECTQILKKLVTDNKFRIKTGMICGHFINSNTGATQKIMSRITELYSDGLI
jgi:3-deoxy-D-manno-octulosonic-acid transferase